MKRLVLLGFVAALLGAGFAHTSDTAVPQKLVGTWVANNGVRMTIKASGRVILLIPGIGSEATTVSVKGTRLTFGFLPTCARKGLYKWAISGRSLTLKVISDRCTLRRSFNTRVWKRR